MKCSNCHTWYNTSKNCPYLLTQCGHSICEQCYTNFKIIKSTIICKVCSKSTSLKKPLPKNRSLIDTLEHPKQQNTQCTLHNKDIEAYCDTDQQWWCIKCIIDFDHKNHQLLTLDKAAVQEKETWNEEFSTLLVLQSSYERYLKEISDEISKFETEIAIEMEACQGFYNGIITIIKEREKEHNKELKEYSTKTLETWSNSKEKLHNLNRCINEITHLKNNFSNLSDIDVWTGFIKCKNVYQQSDKIKEEEFIVNSDSINTHWWSPMKEWDTIVDKIRTWIEVKKEQQWNSEIITKPKIIEIPCNISASDMIRNKSLECINEQEGKRKIINIKKEIISSMFKFSSPCSKQKKQQMFPNWRSVKFTDNKAKIWMKNNTYNNWNYNNNSIHLSNKAEINWDDNPKNGVEKQKPQQSRSTKDSGKNLLAFHSINSLNQMSSLLRIPQSVKNDRNNHNIIDANNISKINDDTVTIMNESGSTNQLKYPELTLQKEDSYNAQASSQDVDEWSCLQVKTPTPRKMSNNHDYISGKLHGEDSTVNHTDMIRMKQNNERLYEISLALNCTNMQNETEQEISSWYRNINCSIFLIGGKSDIYTRRFSLEKLSFTSIKTLKIPRSSFALIPYKEKKCLILGGKINQNGIERITDWISWICIETFKNDKLDFKLRTPRCSFLGWYVLSKLFICGGFDGRSVLDTFEYFDKKWKRWFDMPKMLHKRKEFSFVQGPDNNSIYVIGGQDEKDNVIKNVERFDINQSKWFKVSSMQVARKGCCSVCMPEGIYVIGGFDGVHYLKSVEKYDFVCKQWTFWPEMNFPKSDFSAVPSRDYQFVYVFGGYNGKPMSCVERYDIIGNKWEYLKDLPSTRYSHCCLMIKE